MPFRAGDVVGGKYEIRKLIGVGNIGYVVSALRTELGDEVALKFLRPELTSNHDLVVRFAREARFAVRIKSEHVACVFDVGALTDGVPFIVMERLEGRDLSRVLSEKGRLPPEVALEYALQVCEALASAHANGIVHRDVKPENLFLARLLDGRSIVKVLDFGISKVALTGSFDNTVPLVRTIASIGSPVYMSPEQIRASRDIDARTDVWALGCVLYELLTGRSAFDAPSLMQICAMILEKDPPPLRTINPDVHPGIESLVAQCLEKDPALRFQTVGELAVALAAFAPDHARVWAERSCYVLNNAESTKVDHDDVHPLRARSGSSGGVAISIAAPPNTDSLPDEAVSFRPSRPWMRWALPATVGAAVGLWFVLRAPSNDALPSAHVESATTTMAPTPAPSAAVVVSPPETAPPPSEAAATAKPEPSAAPPAAIPANVKAVRKAGAAANAKTAPPKDKEKAKSPSSRPEPGEGEPDVGF
jgi:serine/threonine-protein kinase